MISRRNISPALRTVSLPGFLAGSILLSITVGALADDWGQLRGPARNGISTEKGWTDTWPSSGPAILWKANVGLGFSGVSVAEGNAVTMGNADNSDTVFCFDALTGRQVWKHTYPSSLGDKYFEGGTTGTPTIDQGRVYTLGRWGDVFCFELNTGKILWRVPLGELEALTQQGVPKTGSQNLGGATVTAGGLVFVAGTADE
ncbi:MAG: PQQ-binding-like beta-propeller repeat protein, partial [Verrucomicrobiota bacterium]